MDQFSFDDYPEQIKLRTAWEQVLKRLAKEAPPGMMDNFLKKVRPLNLVEGTATFAASGRFVLEWVQQKYKGRLQEMLSDELGMDVFLELIAESNEKAPQPDAPASVAPSAIKTHHTTQGKFQPNERYTFDNFVIGQSNRLAVAGAKAIAGDPGGRLNPLFIYGTSGLGKTHLLHAIANEILARNPNYPIAYVTGQQFIEEFVNALQANRVDSFRRLHRGVELWLVDDIQFIAGRDKTQEEFFHTFNYLHSLGKQIVLISDHPPRALRMDERLTSRFEAGLVADIQPPDTETRCAIILSKAHQDGIEIEAEVAMYLAEHVPGNIRVLEGSLTRLATQASVIGVPPNMELATSIVETHYKQANAARPSFTQILNAVSKEFDVAIDEIKGLRRTANIVHARHVAIYLTRHLTHDSWKHIGSLFGDRDHTSMIHGNNKIEDMMQHDKEFRKQVKTIMRGLSSDQ